MLEISGISFLALMGIKEAIGASSSGPWRRLERLLLISAIPLLAIFTFEAVRRIAWLPLIG